jgi:hypothetical protein
MLALKKAGWNGRCHRCDAHLPVGSQVYVLPNHGAMHCLDCGDFSPPEEPHEPGWFDREFLPSGSYRLRSTWKRRSSCVACQVPFDPGDWIYWSPRFPKTARCAACGDFPPPPTSSTLEPNSMVSSREIDWLRSLARVTFAEVN